MNQKKTILISYMMDPLRDESGGGVVYVKNLLKHQVCDYNVIFLGTGSKSYIDNNITFIRITRQSKNYALFNLKVFLWNLFTKKHYDFIHVHRSYFILPFLFSGKPMLVTLHGRTFDVVRENAGHLSRFLIPIFKYIERLSLRKATALFPVSEVVAESFLEKHPFFKYKALTPSMINNWPYVNSNEERDGVLFVGRLEKIKRIAELGNLWEKYADRETLKIVGDGPEKRLLKGYSKVQLLGRLSNLETLEEMRKSKLVVLCSYSEASPTVLKEALITGTSFLSTDVGDAKMLSEVFKGCLVVPELDENFVSAAENLAQTHNPNFAKTNHELAKQFTSKEIYNRYRKHYEDILCD